MIIVDTSVWIDYFNGTLSEEVDSLDSMLGNQEILLGDLILTEILQGFQKGRLFREAQNMLESFPIVPMLGMPLVIQSAENYHTLRKRGVTVRKTIDVMIGTYCIEQHIPLLCVDRDFDPMVMTFGTSLCSVIFPLPWDALVRRETIIDERNQGLEECPFIFPISLVSSYFWLIHFATI